MLVGPVGVGSPPREPWPAFLASSGVGGVSGRSSPAAGGRLLSRDQSLGGFGRRHDATTRSGWQDPFAMANEVRGQENSLQGLCMFDPPSAERPDAFRSICTVAIVRFTPHGLWGDLYLRTGSKVVE